MKCDSCGREIEDSQLTKFDGSGIRFCTDREGCTAYRKYGRVEEVAEGLIDFVIRESLFHATCATDSHHKCVVVWSSGAKEQIAAFLTQKMKGANDLAVQP